MLKKALIVVATFAVLLMVAVTYLTARFVDHKEILRAQAEAEQLRTSRDSILTAVARRDTVALTLSGMRDSLLAVASGLRGRVQSMESQRAAAQLGVRLLRTSTAEEETLHKTFPELSTRMRVSDLFDAENRVSVQYLMVPLVAAAETFVIDHQNSLAFERQRNTLLTIDSLHQHVTALQDSILTLEHANRLAFQQGYDSAFAKYADINQKYISLLEKPPQVRFGLPSWGTILVSTAAGVVLGRQIK